MRVLTFSILFMLFAFTKSALAQPFQQNSSDTIEGIITKAEFSSKYDFPFTECHLYANGDTLELVDYGVLDSDLNYYINKHVRLSYNEISSLKEVDMFVNDTTVYYNRKAKDISKAIKVEGILDIYDYGCGLPGRYYIRSDDSTVTAISHFVSSKYQTPHEGKKVTLYYRIQKLNMISDLFCLAARDSTKSKLIANHLNEIPEDFFKQTGISKESIATKEIDFSPGCLRGENDKFIKLEYLQTDKKKNTQVIRLTFGGKRVYTKEYRLSTDQKGVLIIKEKDL